ncbi:Ger(x)C family spore germination protein [Bacillus taeanensis]|uniref:Ger(X)C family spore germination protein n=1 Tax=Bacillus taeanensis TaxID=273032 RepID=A0A366Y104_9BACI|nr:Ger(x)C family spore germination protein [Bacillus taeanensis]RBW70093.1 Ger(x)C family spore germination protein [Bacillus taeanensis]
MRILQFIFVWTSIFLLTGCWDRTELNDVALIRGIGLDQKKDNLIEVTVEISVPQMQSGEGSSGEGRVLIRTGQGTTIADALEHLKERIPRKIFWGHSEVIVIGEKLAEKGISNQIDFFIRYREPRLRSYVFVTKGNAKDVLALRPPIEKASSEVLRELAVSEVLMNVTLIELLQMLKGDAAALPMIERLPPEEGQDPLQTIAYINRTAVFKQDKMIGLLDDKVTRGVLWIRDEIKEAYITVKPEEENGYVSMTLIRARTELIPKIKDGKWKMTVKAVTENDVILNESSLRLEEPKNIKVLEKALEKEIEGRLKVTIDQVQKEMEADIFGFAEAFERKYPEKWNEVKGDWEEIFPKVEVTFDIKAHVLRTGVGRTT